MKVSKTRKERLAQICMRYNIEILYAFGSRSDEIKEWIGGRVRDLRQSESDVDLGAKPRRGVSLSIQEKVQLATELEDLLGANRVDLCMIDRADPFLAADIIRGERLYCQDEERADEYDLYVLRRAGDFVPLERERMRLSFGESFPSP